MAVTNNFSEVALAIDWIYAQEETLLGRKPIEIKIQECVFKLGIFDISQEENVYLEEGFKDEFHWFDERKKVICVTCVTNTDDTLIIGKQILASTIDHEEFVGGVIHRENIRFKGSYDCTRYETYVAKLQRMLRDAMLKYRK